LRKDIIYSEGFLQILTKEDSLGLDYAILDEIMNVLECVVEDSLWEFLVLLGSKTGGEGGRSKLAAGEFGNGYHCPGQISRVCPPREFSSRGLQTSKSGNPGLQSCLSERQVMCSK
jgi:hypothetical protein